MRILILGSGGREHALAWKIKASPDCDQLFIAPGNGGTEYLGTNIDANPNDFDQVADIIMEKKIDMVIVGPEAPLVEGIVEHFQNREGYSHVMVIGPGQEAAQLEGSKSFAKEFMGRNNIPTAAYKEFKKAEIENALEYIRKRDLPIVIKADGLAAGKGVVICQNHDEAEKELKAMLEEARFGKASEKVIIEEFLEGREFSVFVLTDGKNFKILPVARDYKRAGEGDTGPNTGGMGAVSPVDFVDDDLLGKSIQTVVKPSIAGLEKEGMPYRGILYCGLMEVNGEPFVIEYNVRFGDPETQVVLPRLKSDLLLLFKSLFDGGLEDVSVEQNEKKAATVVLASKGYPGSYEKGKPIRGLEEKPDILFFHAGTSRISGDLTTSGGRVIAVTGLGPTQQIALAKAYFAVEEVMFEGKQFRKDIGI